MRANRLLGAALVEHNLVKIEDLEKANERLLEVINTKQARQSTVLGVLAYELKVVREDEVLQYIVENEGVGLVDLKHYDTLDEMKKTLDLGACWATWSVPFDREEEFYFIATAYYLSPAVRSFWEKQYGTQIIWYGTTLDVMADYLEKLETERANSGTRSPFPGGSKPPIPEAGTEAPGTRNPFPAASKPPMPLPALGSVPPTSTGVPATARAAR
jgi:hypothetical protein